MSPKTWTYSSLTDEKKKEKHFTLNASAQAEYKVQYKSYYANTKDST